MWPARPLRGTRPQRIRTAMANQPISISILICSTFTTQQRAQARSDTQSHTQRAVGFMIS